MLTGFDLLKFALGKHQYLFQFSSEKTSVLFLEPVKSVYRSSFSLSTPLSCFLFFLLSFFLHKSPNESFTYSWLKKRIISLYRKSLACPPSHGFLLCIKRRIFFPLLALALLLPKMSIPWRLSLIENICILVCTPFPSDFPWSCTPKHVVLVSYNAIPLCNCPNLDSYDSLAH